MTGGCESLCGLAEIKRLPRRGDAQRYYALTF